VPDTAAPAPAAARTAAAPARDADDGFAAHLRRASQPQHTAAETAPFVGRLLGGRLDLAGYRAMVVQHRTIYAALERAADELASHPVVGAFVDPRLDRLAAIAGDLRWLDAKLGPAEVPVLPAADAYAQRILELAATWPGGYVAHHYVRYLGDLSGGRHLGNVLTRTFGGGTGFYRFEEIDDPRGFKDAYRAALDAAPWDAEERAAITAEVITAYEHHGSLFAQLEDACPAGPVGDA
jgi:heme oxygenase